MRKLSLLLPLLSLLGACAGTGKFADNAPPKMIGSALWQSESFNRWHPDLQHRLRGQAHYEDGNYDDARSEFALAAGWGDKLSQAMLAEMFWEGRGARIDRAAAYAWMDLAAERGFVAFVSKREKYWNALRPEERIEAARIGTGLYAEFGDAMALPRLAFKLKRGVSGSVMAKAGYTTLGKVITPGHESRVILKAGVGGYGPLSAIGGIQLDLGSFYEPEFWRLDQYLDWHGKQLELVRRGLVEVGQPEAIPAPVVEVL